MGHYSNQMILLAKDCDHHHQKSLINLNYIFEKIWKFDLQLLFFFR